MIIVQCPHCNVFRNPEKEPCCACPTAQQVLQSSMALIIAEHEKMRERLIELEEIYDDAPIRWRSNGEPIAKLDEEVKAFLKEKSEMERRAERKAELRSSNFSNN